MGEQIQHRRRAEGDQRVQSQLTDIAKHPTVVAPAGFVDEGVIEADLTPLEGKEEVHAPQHLQLHEQLVDGIVVQPAVGAQGDGEGVPRHRRDEKDLPRREVVAVLFGHAPLVPPQSPADEADKEDDGTEADDRDLGDEQGERHPLGIPQEQ